MDVLAWAGVAGPPVFVAVFLVLGAVKPGYDATARFVSEGSIGELGWVQIVNFVVFGIVLLAFALALWNGYGTEISGRTGSVLIAVAGVGLVLAGVFVTDPGTKIVSRRGLVHVITSMVVFGSLMLACFAFAWRLHTQTGFAVYSVTTALLIPIGIVLTTAAGRWAGLVQRALIMVVWTWIAALAWKLATT